MKPRFLLPLVLVGCLLPLCHVAAMTDKEMLAVINKVNQRMNRGDVTALDDLKTIPSDTAVPALLMFYRQNHVVMRETPENRKIASKSAQLVAEVPGADVYLKGLFKKQTTENLPGWFERQREAAVDAMVQVHSKFAIRVLADALTAPDRGMDAARLGSALADMNIPSAPYSKATRKAAGSPDGVAKWSCGGVPTRDNTPSRRSTRQGARQRREDTFFPLSRTQKEPAKSCKSSTAPAPAWTIP